MQVAWRGNTTTHEATFRDSLRQPYESTKKVKPIPDKQVDAGRGGAGSDGNSSAQYDQGADDHRGAEERHASGTGAERVDVTQQQLKDAGGWEDETGFHAPASYTNYCISPMQQPMFAPVQQLVHAPQQQLAYAPQQQLVYAPQQQLVYAPQQQLVYAPVPQQLMYSRVPIRQRPFSTVAPAEENFRHRTSWSTHPDSMEYNSRTNDSHNRGHRGRQQLRHEDE